jgi:tetratricopeptide (TPR) repeat protein
MKANKFVIIASLFAVLALQGKISAGNIVEDSAIVETYHAGDYDKAAELCEQALRENGESSKIRYNLANAYYKSGKTGKSILNYERALLLDPTDKDTKHNLAVARLKTIDKIEPVGEFFLATWLGNIRDMQHTNRWSAVAIAGFIIILAAIALYYFTRRISLRKIGFYVASSLLIPVIAANIFAYNGKQRLINRNTAIIMAPTTTIKSSPDITGTDLFILHEGTKVTINSKLNTWLEIETADGNIGWIQGKELETI